MGFGKPHCIYALVGGVFATGSLRGQVAATCVRIYGKAGFVGPCVDRKAHV